MAIKHTIRAKEGGTREINLTALKAIRFQCYECMGFNWNEIDSCSSELCSLFPFRSGKTGKKRKGNAEALRLYHENRLSPK